MDEQSDQVFRALSDPTRRRLLDRLHEEHGLTLGELCRHEKMTRQALTQHIGVLQAAGLVATVRRGRERLHYLNPVPIHEISERWIGKFETSRLNAITSVKKRAEESDMADKPSFVYVTYIEAPRERVWSALMDPELTAQYWGHSNVSDWKSGSRWEHLRVDGSGVVDVVGRVLEVDPPRRLVLTFASPGPEPDDESRVTFEIEPHGGIVRLTVIHEELASEGDREAVSHGWPAVLCNLKSLMETGSVMADPPWEMHADERAARMARSGGS